MLGFSLDLFGSFNKRVYLCCMKLLELEARTYIGREYKEFLKSQEDIDEDGNEWKRNLDIHVPKTYPSKVMIDPERIVMAIESYSFEEMMGNPETPEFDSVDLCLMDGVQISLVGNMEHFKAKLAEFYEENGA